MTRDVTHQVSADQSGETLAAVLRRQHSGMSWTKVRGLIEGRRISVNGNLCLDPARRLKANEIVKVHGQPLRPPPREADCDVVYCDSDVVVINKPSGMTSVRHPAERRLPARRRQKQPTLDELVPMLVARHEGKRNSDARNHIRPVHRLDRETSGLLVFARTVDAERHLGIQFRDHTVYRRYQAVVWGQIEAQTIESHLILDRGDGRRGSTSVPGLGQRAVTHVRPIENLNQHTLVECRLETGRTHQIRIHMLESGHPVAGDKVYRKTLDGPVIPDISGSPRLALHAAELGFVHPRTEERLQFFAPLPQELNELLKRLRSRP